MLLFTGKYIPKSNITWFGIIFLTHLLFKSLYLDHCGFWYDETFGLWYSQQDWGLIKHTSEWDLNPPLYYYFLWIWRNLFGISEYSIRFSSVLFSSLSAGLIFLFSTRYFNRTTAFLSVLIFTASSNILFFAHEARCYSIVLFLALCSSWLFLDLCRRKKMLSAILLGLVNFLLIYTHYIAGFVLLWQAVIILFLGRKELLKPFVAIAVVIVGLCLWRFTAKTINLILHHKEGFWLGKPGLYELKNAFYDYFNNSYTFLFYLLISVFLLLHLFSSKKLRGQSQDQKIGFFYILFCGIVTILVSFFIGRYASVFLMRYLLYTSPFLYITIAWLISISEQKIKYAASSLVMLMCVFSISQFELRTEKSMNYRDAMAVIKKLESPETIILVETKDIAPLFTYYYDKDIFKDFNGMQTRMNQKNIYFVTNTEDVKALDLSRYHRIILTQSFDGLNAKNDELLAYLSSTYHKKAEVKYYNEVNILAYSK